MAFLMYPRPRTHPSGINTKSFSSPIHPSQTIDLHGPNYANPPFLQHDLSDTDTWQPAASALLVSSHTRAREGDGGGQVTGKVCVMSWLRHIRRLQDWVEMGRAGAGDGSWRDGSVLWSEWGAWSWSSCRDLGMGDWMGSHLGVGGCCGKGRKGRGAVMGFVVASPGEDYECSDRFSWSTLVSGSTVLAADLDGALVRLRSRC